MLGFNYKHKHFFRGSFGTAAVEFALVAPVFFFLLIAIIECAMMYIVQNALDAAAREAGRFGMTGAAEPGYSREEAIKNKVISVAQMYSAGLIKTDSDDFTIEVSAYSSLENLAQPEPYTDLTGVGHYVIGDPYVDVNGNGQWDEDQGQSGSFGVGGQVVNYKIIYKWRSCLTAFGVPAIVTLTGSTPISNEKF